MEKFLNHQNDKIGIVERMVYHRRGDNMKIVDHPLFGMVDVCPYPESHFTDLEAEAKRIRHAWIKRHYA